MEHETITPEELEKELTEKYGQPGPERDVKIFLDQKALLEERARKLIPEIDEISDIEIGCVKDIEGGFVLTSLDCLAGDGNEVITSESNFTEDFATKYGEIECGLPIAFIGYTTKKDSEKQDVVIPWDINAPKKWVILRPDFDYSRFAPKPEGMKEMLDKLRMGHLKHLGKLSGISSIDYVRASRLKRRKIQDLEEKGVYDWHGMAVRGFVEYKTLGGTVIEIGEEHIQEIAQIETNKGKGAYYIIGTYSIGRSDGDVMAVLCVRDLQEIKSGRVLGRHGEVFSLDEIVRYQTLSPGATQEP